MKLHIEIVCDNAAFGETQEERHREVVRILVASMRLDDEDRPLRDINGNRVGRIWWEKD